MRNETLTERQAIAAGNITTLSSSSVNTGNGMNASILEKLRLLVHIGAVSAGATLTVSLQVASSSGGSFTPVTGLTTLPILSGFVPVANTVLSIEISSDLLLPSGDNWVRGVVQETAGFNCTVSLILIGDESAYKPVMTTTGGQAQTPGLSTATFGTNGVVVAHV